MDGIELTIRFASKPNELKYCGPNCATSDFPIYLNDKSNLEDVKKSILRFEALPVYLRAIAKKNNLDIFDYKVAEAYWIGNELLDNFTVEDMKEIIDELIKRGMYKPEGEKLKERLVEGLLPHHIFHVFYVEIGKTSGKIEPLFKFKETCRPSFGKVKRILEDKLIVLRTPIINLENKKYKLSVEEESEILYEKKFVGKINPNDYVAIHWGQAVLKLNKSEVKNLEKYTNGFLNIFERLKN